jgi:hypothetical protein
MAKILISEPHDAARWLLQRMLTRLNHEPIAVKIPSPEQLTHADIFILEPAAPVGAALAQAANIANPTLPLISASVTSPPPELAQLGVLFTASLIKPFTIEQLRNAIDDTLAPRDRYFAIR